jgi:Type IV secretion system pilin
VNHLSLLAFRLLAAPTSIIEGIDPNTDGLNAVPKLLHNGINIALFLAGGLSVVFVAVGGLNFSLSSGNPQKAKTARETIIYALVGLVVSSGAFAIINYVVHIF